MSVHTRQDNLIKKCVSLFSIVGCIATVFRASDRFHNASRDVSESKFVRPGLKNVRLGSTNSL